MTYAEMMIDSGVYLAFYAFGLASGVAVCWIEDYTQKRKQEHGKRN